MTGDTERNDVSLCFQAMGLEFGASPEEVEKAYRQMLAVARKKQASPDPAVRAEAANDLELAQDLYEKITGSLTYKSRVREQEHAGALREQGTRSASVPLAQFKTCPSCHKPVVANLKKCPYCSKHLLTPAEAFFARLFSGTGLAIMLLLAAGALGVVVYTNYTSLFTKPARPKPAAGSFANSSGSSAASFANISGAAAPPKP